VDQQRLLYMHLIIYRTKIKLMLSYLSCVRVVIMRVKMAWNLEVFVLSLWFSSGVAFSRLDGGCNEYRSSNVFYYGINLN
jgi:hypothetical protein